MKRPQVVVPALIAGLMFAGTAISAQGEVSKKVENKAAAPAKVAAPAPAKVEMTDAEKAKATAEAEKAQAAAYAKMTKEEIVTRIKDVLANKEEIIQMIPGLVKDKDATGNIVYKFNGTKLEDIDKETAWKIMGRVQNEASRINIERLNRQMAQIKQIEAANKASQQARQMRTYTPPPRPTTIYNPPRTPAAPPRSSTQIPKIPKLPTNQQGR